MEGCILQWYLFVPVLLKVCENLCPGPRRPESNDLPLFAVAVCVVLSLLIHLTLLPTPHREILHKVVRAGRQRNPLTTDLLVLCLLLKAARLMQVSLFTKVRGKEDSPKSGC